MDREVALEKAVDLFVIQMAAVRQAPPRSWQVGVKAEGFALGTSLSPEDAVLN